MSLDHPCEGPTPTAIRTNLGAIFVSLELSRSTWLITSLSPGGGEKMSKHSVSAGDIATLLARFSELMKKAFARTGRTFPIIVIQEAGLDGFWVFKRVNAAYPYGVRLWDADTGNTLDDVRLCKSLDDAIYSAGGAMSSQRAQRARSGKERAA